jgi:hypothetical protein
MSLLSDALFAAQLELSYGRGKRVKSVTVTVNRAGNVMIALAIAEALGGHTEVARVRTSGLSEKVRTQRIRQAIHAALAALATKQTLSGEALEGTGGDHADS